MSNSKVFAASNGWKVEIPFKGIRTYTPTGISVDGRLLSDDAVTAVTEYVLHRHGLWLAPNRLLCAPVKEDPDMVMVLSRKRNAVRLYMRSDFEGLSSEYDNKSEAAARAFFGAHAPKPELAPCAAALEVHGRTYQCEYSHPHSGRHACSVRDSLDSQGLLTWETDE